MSVQVNVRLESEMLREIDALAKAAHMSRTDWIRMKIVDSLHQDLLIYSDTIILSYCKGRISGDELRSLLGKNAESIAEEMYPKIIKKKG